MIMISIEKGGKALKRSVKVLFVLGLILTIGGPYFPSFIYNLIYLYNYRTVDFRFENVIPCIRACGIVLSAWGIVIYMKEEK